MSRVRLLTWSPDLNKVALTKLIREGAEVPLNEAHDAVNRLLAGETVEVETPTEQGAQQFAQEVRNLGVRAECVGIEISAP